MSTAELKEMREEVKKLIDRADERVVRMAYAMLESDAEEDWWDTMPAKVRNRVTEALEQADKGEVLTHEQVKKKHPQWFTK